MARTAVYSPVIPTAEPFLFLGDDVGILLVHGFTGPPKEMRTMCEFFAGKGKTVPNEGAPKAKRKGAKARKRAAAT